MSSAVTVFMSVAAFFNQDARRCAQLWGSDGHSAKAEARKRRQAAHHGFARVASSTAVSAVAWDLRRSSAWSRSWPLTSGELSKRTWCISIAKWELWGRLDETTKLAYLDRASSKVEVRPSAVAGQRCIEFDVFLLF